MNKIFYIIVLVVFGFLEMPSTAFACKKNNSDIDSCKREVSSKPVPKNCCDTSNNEDNKNHNGCGSCEGKCGHSNCNIRVVQTALLMPYFNQVNAKNLFLYIKKGNFYILETPISSGFQSLWLIPKIG